MPISIFAASCAALTLLLLIAVYFILLSRRNNGKSDTHQSRIGLVIASVVVPLLVTVLFVAFTVIVQHFYQYPVPVGKHGGGVFIVFMATIATALLTLIILLPRIKHKWQD